MVFLVHARFPYKGHFSQYLAAGCFFLFVFFGLLNRLNLYNLNILKQFHKNENHHNLLNSMLFC